MQRVKGIYVKGGSKHMYVHSEQTSSLQCITAATPCNTLSNIVIKCNEILAAHYKVVNTSHCFYLARHFPCLHVIFRKCTTHCSFVVRIERCDLPTQMQEGMNLCQNNL